MDFSEMKKYYILLLIFTLSCQDTFAAKVVVMFINTKNECLGCNIGISNLLNNLNNKHIQTTIYFKNITNFQYQKYCRDVNFDFQKNTKVINAQVAYESALYDYLKLRSIDSYVLILDEDKMIYKCNLIRLVENKTELDKFNYFLDN